MRRSYLIVAICTQEVLRIGPSVNPPMPAVKQAGWTNLARQNAPGEALQVETG